jgi:hypothetical protein
MLCGVSYTQPWMAKGPSPEWIARRFCDAFNDRDAEALVALADPEVRYYPTALVGGGRGYEGHDGLRQWVAELRESGIEHRGRVRTVRQTADGFLLLSDVLLDDRMIATAAMLTVLNDRSAIVEARVLFTDAELLERLGTGPDEISVFQ